MSLAVYLKAIDTCSTGAETTQQTNDMASKGLLLRNNGMGWQSGKLTLLCWPCAGTAQQLCQQAALQAATDSGLFLCAQ
jgi:hypothetical protein